jgi:hypothetical protein
VRIIIDPAVDSVVSGTAKIINGGGIHMNHILNDHLRIGCSTHVHYAVNTVGFRLIAEVNCESNNRST